MGIKRDREAIEIRIPGPWQELLISLLLGTIFALATFTAISVFRVYGEEPLGKFSRDHTQTFVGLVFTIAGSITFLLRTSWQWTHGLLLELGGMHDVLEKINNQFTQTNRSLEEIKDDISFLESENAKRKAESISIFAYLEGQSGKKLSELRNRLDMSEE